VPVLAFHPSRPGRESKARHRDPARPRLARSGPWQDARVADDSLAALEQAILDRPGDDAPRLVWGDAVGGERGELVTVECALAAGGLAPEKRDALTRREAELLSSHGAQWSGLQGFAERWRFRRGFVDAVEVDASLLLARETELLAAAPLLRGLSLLGLTANDDEEGVRTGPDVPALLQRLLDSPVLERIDGLELVGVGTTWQRDSEFNSSGFDGLGDRVAALLAESGLASRLKQLGLTTSRVGPDGARALARADLSRLEQLWLEGQELGDEAALEQLAPGHLPRLTSLKLTGQNDTSRRKLTGRIAPLLPTSLRELHLDWNFARDDTVRALADSPAAPTLTHLALGHGWFDAEGLRELERFPGLHTLDLAGASIGYWREPARQREAFRALTELRMPSLRVLGLAGCSFDEPGIRALVAAFGRRLEVLDLRGNPKAERMLDELRLEAAASCRILVGGGHEEREPMLG